MVRAQGPGEASSTLSAPELGENSHCTMSKQRDDRESAGGFCLSLEPGQSKEQRECIELLQTAPGFWQISSWKLNQ